MLEAVLQLGVIDVVLDGSVIAGWRCDGAGAGLCCLSLSLSSRLSN